MNSGFHKTLDQEKSELQSYNFPRLIVSGSALFNNQSSTSGGDKHKETNILLKQKLQKNSQLQKQREKLQVNESCYNYNSYMDSSIFVANTYKIVNPKTPASALMPANI